MKLLEVDHSHPLYPTPPKLEEGYLKVSDIHELYYATYGNPKGIPVILLHGGPGAGFHETSTKVFNPEKYYIIGFDQRGALRSKPFASLEENTSQHLRDDIEKLRKHLQIDKWLVFGGSWGSALAILYGQTYPEKCLGFILRGINLLRKDDIDHLLYGMGKIFPDAYAPVIDLIPEKERSDLFTAYYKRVISSDPTIALEAARTFVKYDIICGTHLPDPERVSKVLQNEKLVLGLAKLFLHYSINDFFIPENHILSQIHSISHLPCTIIHGRWDAICLPVMAYSLHKAWPGSTLWIVTQGGHTGNDPAITRSLATATDLFIDLTVPI